MGIFQRLTKYKVPILLFLFIITIPTITSLINNQYFSMHDDQDIARLFLLDTAIKQGSLYPRWIGGLGFGFGYPLYNFYPPLIYYVSEAFHLIGLSYIASIKLMLISGVALGTFGTYYLAKKIVGKKSALISSVLFTFFSYRAVILYVRGAFAEFFAMSLLPLVFLSFYNLFLENSLKNSVIFGTVLAFLILAHPLIAFPAIIFLGIYFIFYILYSKDRFRFIKYAVLSTITSLSLSAFFWLPSMAERKFTLTDRILLTELANYKLHYIFPQQFWYSPWGFGGSIDGPFDGLSFQLGKVYIGFVALSIILAVIYYCLQKLKKISLTQTNSLKFYILYLFLLLLSLFMTTNYSFFIWDSIKPLAYLQFPWRLLTFTSVFIAVTGGFAFYYIYKIIIAGITCPKHWGLNKKLEKALFTSIIFISILLVILINSKYFKPQRLFQTSDKERTEKEEIEWRISRTSFEFIPRGVKTAKSSLNTTIPAISKKDIPDNPYTLTKGKGSIETLRDNFQEKEFQVKAQTSLVFRLNTFNFPGWKAYIDNKEIQINDNNDFRLITVVLPKGSYIIRFVFVNTPVRNIGNTISIASLLFFISLGAIRRNKNKQYF